MNTYIELAAASGKEGFTRNGGRLLRKNAYTVNLWRQYYKNTDVYAAVFERLEPNFQSPLIAPFYFEMDGEINGSWHNALQEVQDATLRLVNILLEDLQMPKDMLRVSFSGSKGFHVMCSPVSLGVKPDRQLNLHYRFLALELAGRAQVLRYLDKKVYDARRVLRLLNSINSKGTMLAHRAIQKIPITIEELATYSISQILNLASQPSLRKLHYGKPTPVKLAVEAYQDAKVAAAADKSRQREEAVAREEGLVSLRGYPVCMSYLLEYGAPAGYRNNALYQLASFLHSRMHMTADEILSAVLDFSGLDSKEIEVTVQSAVTRGHQVGCRSPYSHLRMLVEDGVTVCNPDICPILEGF